MRDLPSRWLLPLAALALASCSEEGPPPALDRAALATLETQAGTSVEQVGDTLTVSRDGQVTLRAWYPEGAELPHLAIIRDGDGWVIWRSPPSGTPYAIATLSPDLAVRHLEPPDLDEALASYGSGVEALAEAALWYGAGAAAELLSAPTAEHASVLAALCTGQTEALAERHDPNAGCVSAPEGLTLCAQGGSITAVDRGGRAGAITPRDTAALAHLPPGDDPLVAAALSACERPDTDALLATAARGLGRGDLRVAGLLRRHGAAPALLEALDSLPKEQARLGRLLAGRPSSPEAAAAALSDPAMADVLRASRCRNGRLTLGDLVLLSGREPMGRDALIAALDGAPSARVIAASLLSDLSRRPPGEDEALALARVLAAELGPIDPDDERLRRLAACRDPSVDELRHAWRLRGNLVRRLAGAAEHLDLAPERVIIAAARDADPAVADAALYALGEPALAERVRRAAAAAVCQGPDGQPVVDDSLSFLYTAISLAESDAAAKAWIDAAAERPCEP